MNERSIAAPMLWDSRSFYGLAWDIINIILLKQRGLGPLQVGLHNHRQWQGSLVQKQGCLIVLLLTQTSDSRRLLP